MNKILLKMILVVFALISVSTESWAMGLFRKRSSSGEQRRLNTSDVRPGARVEDFNNFDLSSRSGSENDENAEEVDIVLSNDPSSEIVVHDDTIIEENILLPGRPQDPVDPVNRNPAIPEPMSLALLGAGLGGFYLARRKR